MSIDIPALQNLPEDGIPVSIINIQNTTEEPVLDNNNDTIHAVTNSAVLSQVHLRTTWEQAGTVLQRYQQVKTNGFAPEYANNTFALAYPWLFPY